MTKLRLGRFAVNAIVLMLLGACAGGGGGGGGGSSIPVSPPPPPPPLGAPRPPPIAVPPMPPAAAPGSFPASSSQEFANNWGPDGINAEAAWRYQSGHGEGVLVGVIDDGIDPNHPELVGRIDTANSIDIVPGRNALTTTLSHGSEISALIAGNFNGTQTVGVAYQASILAIRADNGADGFNSADIANAINYAVSKGVDVINLSLGSGTPSPSVVRDAIRAATTAGVIVVVSAGNDGPSATQPIYPGFLATDPAISNGLILIAGGSNPDGSFNPASNIAGSAANNYLVAPGWQIFVPDMGPPGAVPGFQTCGLGPDADLCRIQGTSYASPHVAGAAALLMSAFPGLTPGQVVQILLQSTDDMGPVGIDATTGWGHLNLARAFQPIGTVAAPLPAAGVVVSATTPIGQVGAAFGDGLTRHSAAWTFAAFDRFGRTYETNFASNWIAPATGFGAEVHAPTLWRTAHDGDVGFAFDIAPIAESLPASLLTMRQGLAEERTAFRSSFALAPGLSLGLAGGGAPLHAGSLGENGHMAALEQETSFSIAQQVGDVASFSITTASGAEVGRAARDRAQLARATFAFGGLRLDASAGAIEEVGGVLGLAPDATLRRSGAGETRFAGFAGAFDVGSEWVVGFSAEFGRADFADGWLEVTEPLETTAFAMNLRRDLSVPWFAPTVQGRGVLEMTISQPLRIEGGALSFAAPVANRYGRSSLRFEQRTIDPSPSGREIRAALAYRYWADDTLSALAEVAYTSDPGHIAGREDEIGLYLGLRARLPAD